MGLHPAEVIARIESSVSLRFFLGLFVLKTNKTNNKTNDSRGSKDGNLICGDQVV